MDVNKLEEAIQNFAKDLNKGLVLSSLWIRGENPIVSYGGGNETASLIFDQISSNIEKALNFIDLPGIDPYYLWKVEGNVIIGAVLVNNIQVGIVFDLNKVSLGVALNIAIPNLVESIKKITA